MNCVDTILELFETRGAEAYLGEPVSQEEHALQTANLAVVAQAPEALVAAALLHDIGHLLVLDERADRRIDQFHEEQASRWLTAHFGPEVTEPIRLHVQAKRYLCAVDPSYIRTLSLESVRSLKLQGAPVTPAQVLSFQQLPFHLDAVSLRRWDDEAKVPGRAVEDLAYYVGLLRRVRTPG